MAGQRIELPSYSMFATTPVYETGGAVVFGLLRDVVVPDVTDVLYDVPSAAEFRLDLISAHFYGTPALWWVIARVNNIEDPMIGAPINSRIRVPTVQRLASQGLLNV